MLYFSYYFMLKIQLLFQSLQTSWFYSYCNQLIKPKLWFFQKVRLQKMYFMIIMKLSKLWKNLNAFPSLDIFLGKKNNNLCEQAQKATVWYVKWARTLHFTSRLSAWLLGRLLYLYFCMVVRYGVSIVSTSLNGSIKILKNINNYFQFKKQYPELYGLWGNRSFPLYVTVYKRMLSY